MKNKKLNLADFKIQADKVEKSEVLEKIVGGVDDDCHHLPDTKVFQTRIYK